MPINRFYIRICKSTVFKIRKKKVSEKSFVLLRERGIVFNMDNSIKKEDNKLSDKKTYISCLRIICCMSVIILHTNGIFWSRPHGMLWISANFLETFFYFAVPVFFMISGATLLDYREKYSTKVFFKKRFSKTIVPFVFWSIVAGLFNAWPYVQEFDFNIAHIIDNILNTKYFGVYWFFPSLYAVYLSMPLLSAVENKISVYTYTVIIGMVCVGILPLCFSLLKLGTWSITPPVVGGYIIYVLLGYIFSEKNLSKKQRYIIYVLGIVGWLLHFLGTIYMSFGTDEIDSTFKGYQNIPAILQAVAVFNLFKYLNYEKINESHIFTEERVNKLATYTLGIYLLHMFPIYYLTNKFAIDTSLIGWRIGGAFIVFIICAIATGVIKRIPILREILP